MWFNDRSEQLVNQLSYEVSHDSLTGLLNRSCLSRHLRVHHSTERDALLRCSARINSFKAINDVYGNYVGDKCCNMWQRPYAEPYRKIPYVAPQATNLLSSPTIPTYRGL
ncbi:GGDEF domain-containing protein [Vibrio chagasii]